MSSSGVRIACDTPVVVYDEATNVAAYFVGFRYVPAIGGHINGGVSVPFEGITETELNAVIQQAIVDHANADYPGNDFTLSDVIGGRV